PRRSDDVSVARDHPAAIPVLALERQISQMLGNECPVAGRPVMRNGIVAGVRDDVSAVAGAETRSGVDGRSQLGATPQGESALASDATPDRAAKRPVAEVEAPWAVDRTDVRIERR